MQESPFRARKGENEKETSEEPAGDCTTVKAPTIGSKVGLRCQPTEEAHDPRVFVPFPREPSPGLTLQVGSEATQDKGKGEENASQQGHGLRRRWTVPNGSRLSCGRLGRRRKSRWTKVRALQGTTPRFLQGDHRPPASSAC